MTFCDLLLLRFYKTASTHGIWGKLNLCPLDHSRSYLAPEVRVGFYIDSCGAPRIWSAFHRIGRPGGRGNLQPGLLVSTPSAGVVFFPGLRWGICYLFRDSCQDPVWQMPRWGLSWKHLVWGIFPVCFEIFWVLRVGLFFCLLAFGLLR